MNFSGHFNYNEILDLWNKAKAAGLNGPGKRNLLLGGIDSNFVGQLPVGLSPNDQLLSDLQKLNDIERLANGEVPLLIWLKTAAALSDSLEQGGTFRQALDHVSAGVLSQPSLPDPTQLPEFQERIVHQNDMVPYPFLALGQAAGEGVAKLRVPRFDNSQQTLSSGNPLIYLGTGWLLSDDLLLTNHHVINARNRGEAQAPLADLHLQAQHTVAQFDFNAQGVEGTMIAVQALEAWDAREGGVGLDYAVLRLSESSQRASLRLSPQKIEGRADGYIPVNIIQHPSGEPKQVAMRNNLVSGSTETDLRYFTDTKSGSSGSPVFDDQWRVVALHRGSVAAEGVKFQGRNSAWLNIGTHITAILEHLQHNFPAIRQEIQP